MQETLNNFNKSMKDMESLLAQVKQKSTALDKRMERDQRRMSLTHSSLTTMRDVVSRAKRSTFTGGECGKWDVLRGNWKRAVQLERALGK